MSQAECYEYLKKNGTSTAREISEYYNVGLPSIRRNLCQLAIHGDVRRVYKRIKGLRCSVWELIKDENRESTDILKVPAL